MRQHQPRTPRSEIQAAAEAWAQKFNDKFPGTHPDSTLWDTAIAQYEKDDVYRFVDDHEWNDFNNFAEEHYKTLYVESLAPHLEKP
jgi:hypothetical protein